MSPSQTLIPWGGLDFPENALQPHSFVIGSPGSGKTLMLRLQMKNALLDWSGALKARALIYDGKREFYPLLIGMGVSPRDIRVLLPTDRRSVPWDIAADIDTPEDTRTLAKSLAPGNEKGSSNEDFFSRATQAILGGVLWSLHLARPRRWNLYDVVDAMRSESTIDAVLSFNDQSRSIFKTYINQPKQGSAVLSTLLNDIVLPFETTAALWKRSTRPGFSLKEWIKKPRSSVLLMMPDPTTTSVQPINRAMFHWAAQLLDSQPEISVLGSDHETWIFLVGSSRVDLQACKLEYSIVSPK